MNRFRRPIKQIERDRRTATVAGAVVHYRECASDGPPLVLIHGLSGSTRWWSRNLTALAEHFRVFAIDLPGFGDNRRWCRFNLAEVATQLCAWLDAIDVPRASIIGHSMGGVIALDMALCAPDRIDRLILVDAPILHDPRSWFRLGFETAAEARLFSPKLALLLVTDALRAGPFTLSRASRETHLRNLQADLSIITAPTLVLWGEYDRMFPPTYGQEVAAALPSATFAVIEGAGHNAMWNQPDAFNHLVLDFLLEQSSRASIPVPSGMLASEKR